MILSLLILPHLIWFDCVYFLRSSPLHALISFQTVTNVLGPDIHKQIFGKVHLVQFDSEGIFGWIPLQKDIVDLFLSGKLMYHNYFSNVFTKTKLFLHV